MRNENVGNESTGIGGMKYCKGFKCLINKKLLLLIFDKIRKHYS